MSTATSAYTPAGSAAAPGPPTAEEFRAVIGRFASGVTVITTRHRGARRGATASAVTSLSLEPPMLVACLNQGSQTGQAVFDTGRFAVNILSEEQIEAAMAFASSKATDKFGAIATHDSPHGIPLLSDALATLECRVTSAPVGGTHYVFLAEVERATARDGAPLTYFSGQMGRFGHPSDDAVTSLLRTMVLDRSITIGSALDLNELASTLNVPCAVIYAALTRLAGEGLVARGDRGSFVVHAISLPAVENALRAREAIEIGAIQRRLGDLTDDELAHCHALVDGLSPRDENGRTADLAAWLQRAVEFLDHLVGLAGSEALLDAYRRVTVPPVVMSLRDPELLADGPHGEADSEFRELLDAVERADLAGVVRVIEARHAELLELSRRALSDAGGKL